MDELLTKALAAGLGLAAVTGPFGCLVVWRRMAYFGDTLAHSALLGVVLGALAGLQPLVGIMAMCVAVALLLARVQARGSVASDTWLGIVSHGALALGLVALSLAENLRINLMGWLFGDILAVTWDDVALVWGGGAVVLAALSWVWAALVAAAVDEDLAAVEGHQVLRARLILMLLMAMVVAAAMKVVGILLVTALLVIPAAAARRLSRTPEQMAALAALAGAVAVGLGLMASWRWDIPAGPAVVAAAVGLFAVVQAVPGRGA